MLKDLAIAVNYYRQCHFERVQKRDSDWKKWEICMAS